MKQILKASATAALALTMTLIIFAPGASAAEDFTIQNPYEDVNWSANTPRRTQLHTHTNASDGRQTMAEALENYYTAGYDFVAFTDHGVVDRGWVKPNYWFFENYFGGIIFGGRKPIVGLTEERLKEMSGGVGRDGRGMHRVPYGIEQNPQGPRIEVNSWFADWGHGFVGGDKDYEIAVGNVSRKGGLCMINHPSNSSYNGGLSLEDIYEGNNNYYVNKVQRLFEKYPALIGLEIPEDRDRKLWDILLANLAPAGRSVFGVATSDSHDADTIDKRWVWALMPESTVENLRNSLEAGAFFSVIRGDNTKVEPMVTEITVENNAITITAENHALIQWISDGNVIATGNTLDLVSNKSKLGAYVRAEVSGEGGVLYTQPFLLSYEGMPEGKPVPSDFVDWGRLVGWLRMLMYPFFWSFDQLWEWVR